MGGSEDRWGTGGGAGGESVGEDEEAKCGLRPAFPAILIITVQYCSFCLSSDISMLLFLVSACVSERRSGSTAMNIRQEP